MMGTCTAVQILEMDDDPTDMSVGGKLHHDQRQSQLEAVWAVLTPLDRKHVTERLEAGATFLEHNRMMLANRKKR